MKHSRHLSILLITLLALVFSGTLYYVYLAYIFDPSELARDLDPGINGVTESSFLDKTTARLQAQAPSLSDKQREKSIERLSLNQSNVNGEPISADQLNVAIESEIELMQ